MAGPLGKYGKEKEARRKAAIKGIGGLTGDIVGLIPGAGAVGAGIKKAAGMLSGDDKMAATPMPKDKKKERDAKVDTIIDGMKSRTQRTQQEIDADRTKLAGKKMEVGELRKTRDLERKAEALTEEEEEEKRRLELTK